MGGQRPLGRRRAAGAYRRLRPRVPGHFFWMASPVASHAVAPIECDAVWPARQTDPAEWEAMQKWLQQKTGEPINLNPDAITDDIEMLDIASK